MRDLHDEFLSYIKSRSGGDDKRLVNNLIKTSMHTVYHDIIQPIDKITYIKSLALTRLQKSQNVVYLSELKNICEMSKKHNIKIIHIKGLFLAYDLYVPIENRIFGDIDLVVKYEEFDIALKIFRELGYEIKSDQKNSTDEELIDFAMEQNHINLYKSINNTIVNIELHADIFNPPNLFSLDINSIFERAIEYMEVEGCTPLVL